MSMVSTLAKVAIGVAVAKGVSSAMGGRRGGAAGGLGGMLGGMLGGGQRGGMNRGGMGGGQAGGLGGMLGGLLGGGQQRGGFQANQAQYGNLTGGRQGGGGLADMLGQAGAAGGLGGVLGGLLGGQQGGQQGGGMQGHQQGGLGGLLDSLSGGAQANMGQRPQQGGLGDMFNMAMAGEEPQPEPSQEETAEILLRAMLNAAKADGRIDDGERAKITERLGEVSPEEAQFVRDELSSPLDLDGFIASVPKGLEQQVYMMSLLAIDLDAQEEAQYLDQLAQGLNISQQASNQIHEQLGAPTLYS